MSRKRGKIVSSVHCKPSSSGLLTYFDGFFPTTYNSDLIFTISFRFLFLNSSFSNAFPLQSVTEFCEVVEVVKSLSNIKFILFMRYPFLK